MKCQFVAQGSTWKCGIKMNRKSMTSPDLVVHAVVEAMFNFKCVISITPSAFGTNFDTFIFRLKVPEEKPLEK